MHLEKDILKGKFGKNKELKKEAREELAEMEEKKKGMAKKMKSGIYTNGKRDKDQELGRMVNDVQNKGKWIKK